MGIKLVCTADFHGVKKGTEITDPVLIEKYLVEKDQHFVRVTAPDPEPEIETFPPPKSGDATK